MKLKSVALLMVSMVLAFVGAAHANLETFNDLGSYATATAGLAANPTAGFDDIVAGTQILSGGIADGITFTYAGLGESFGPFKLEVETGFDTTSSPNYLGTTGDQTFGSGDSFTMTFSSAINAIALDVIGNGSINDAGDFTLAAAPGSVQNAGNPNTTLGDGGTVFFLGLVDFTQSFTSVTFSSLGGSGFLFNIDDIQSASVTATATVTPEPESLALFVFGLIAVVGAFRMRRPEQA